MDRMPLLVMLMFLVVWVIGNVTSTIQYQIDQLCYGNRLLSGFVAKPRFLSDKMIKGRTESRSEK